MENRRLLEGATPRCRPSIMSAFAGFRTLLATALFIWTRKRLSSVYEHKAFPFVVPGVSAASLAFAALQRLSGRRPMGLTSVSGVVRLVSAALEALALSVGYPLALADAFRDSADADWVAMAGIFLGTLLGHRQACVMLLLMVTGGEVLEEYAVSKAGGAVDALMGWKARAPQRVACLIPASDEKTALGDAAVGRGVGPRSTVLEVCDVKEVRRGSLIVVRAGEVIPIDGRVRAVRSEGASSPEALACRVGESALTGELQPVLKLVGDTVLSGTVLHDCRSIGAAIPDAMFSDALQLASFAVNNSIVVEASCQVDECTSALVAASWEAALNQQSNKARLERASSRYAALFAPFTFVVAAAAALLMRPQAREGRAVRQRLERALCVLMAATPCPLSIGVPIAFIGAMSNAANLGITLKRATVVEKLAAATTVVLDKTGTLTCAEMRVDACVVHAAGGDSANSADFGARILADVSAAEAESTHIVGRCLFEFASKASATDLTFTAARAPLVRTASVGPVDAQGVATTHDGRRVLVGSLAFVSANTAAAVVLHDCSNVHEGTATADTGSSMRVFVVSDNEHAATFFLTNDIRVGAMPLLSSLRNQFGLKIALLSGDTTENVTRLLQQLLASQTAGSSHLRLSDISVFGGCLPQDKVARIEAMKASGEVVVMVGDGLNDAAALTAADVGIAVGSSAHGLTAESADAVLLSQDLRAVGSAIAISRNAVGCARGVVRFGMGASLTQMMAAAAGLLSPLVNSVLQEVVDLSAIAKALTVVYFTPH